jgi:hypothetical protein
MTTHTQSTIPKTTPTVHPITQDKNPGSRDHWPAWMKELPSWVSIKSRRKFSLIDREQLKVILDKAKPEDAARFTSDLEFLEQEMGESYVEWDREAKVAQNRYRRNQINYILLAMAATIVGSFQAVVVGHDANLLRSLGFIETVIAVFAVFLSTGFNAIPPLPEWIKQRRRTESLRQEYFRFLMHQAPYDDAPSDLDRQGMLRARVGDINSGKFPSIENKES